MPIFRLQIVVLYLLACILVPRIACADLLPGDFAVIRVSKDEVIIMALKQIPQNEQIRVTDDFWVNGAFDDSGNEAVFTLSQALAPGEQYLLDLSSSGVLLDWNKTLHFYQLSATPGTASTRHLFMIEANLDGLRWFPTPPGLIQDISHIIITDIDSLSGEIDHILNDSLLEKDLTPFEWHRALGNFRAWIPIDDFPYLPIAEFLDFQLNVATSPGVVTFSADSYNLTEEEGIIRVPVRRQYGCFGAAAIDVEAKNETPPLSDWENMGPDDYYADLTGVAYSLTQNYAVAISPDSGVILQGNSSGWLPQDTNGQTGENLKLTSITSDGTDFWACASDGKIYKSADGINWAEKYAPATGATSLLRILHLKNAAQANQPALIAVGANGLILYEDPFDGWQISPSNTSKKLYSVAFDGLEYIAVGEDGTVLSSQSLSSGWQAHPNSFQTNLYAVTFAPFASAGGFYVAGQNGTILFTDDVGDGFTQIESGTKRTLLNIQFATLEIDSVNGITADYVLACGAGGTIVVSEEGNDFEMRRSMNRASALYAATPIEDSNGITKNFLTVGEYGARVKINTERKLLSGNLQNIKLDDNPSTSISWAHNESSEKLIFVEASSVDLFRQRIDLCLTRPVSGGGNYRIGRQSTEINLMNATGSEVYLTTNFGPLLYIVNNRIELNPQGEWEFKFSIGNTSKVASGKLFLRFEGTNLPNWSIPENLLPGSGSGIEPLSVSDDIVCIVRQPVEAVSLYEEFNTGVYVLKYRQIINSLWVSPTWSPNEIFPRSIGIYLEDDGSLPDPGIPGINSNLSGGSSI